jgi:hypothetical protein
MPFNFVHFDVIFTVKPFFSVFPLLACQISCQLFCFCKKEASNFHVNIFSFLNECGPFSPPFACSDHRQNQQKAGSVFVQDAKRAKSPLSFLLALKSNMQKSVSEGQNEYIYTPRLWLFDETRQSQPKRYRDTPSPTAIPPFELNRENAQKGKHTIVCMPFC